MGERDEAEGESTGGVNSLVGLAAASGALVSLHASGYRPLFRYLMLKLFGLSSWDGEKGTMGTRLMLDLSVDRGVAVLERIKQDDRGNAIVIDGDRVAREQKVRTLYGAGHQRESSWRDIA